jgi:hypothetical protein
MQLMQFDSKNKKNAANAIRLKKQKNAADAIRLKKQKNATRGLRVYWTTDWCIYTTD